MGGKEWKLRTFILLFFLSVGVIYLYSRISTELTPRFTQPDEVPGGKVIRLVDPRARHPPAVKDVTPVNAQTTSPPAGRDVKPVTAPAVTQTSSPLRSSSTSPEVTTHNVNRLPTTGACPGQVFTPPSAIKTWVLVAGTPDTYIYSAFMDGKNVRLIAVTRGVDRSSLLCHLWYDVTGSGGKHVTQDMATVQIIPENHGTMYTAAYIFCTTPKDRAGQLPIAVSIVQNKCQALANSTLPVRHIGHMTTNFTICISPLNHGYRKVHQLVETIEFNRILGGQRLAFYNYSISPVISKILRYYESKGVVDIYQWNMPVTRIHYYGQLAALNDCLFQYRNRSKYLVNQDLDEFIIPAGNTANTWDEFMKKKQKSNPKVGIWIVRNVFVRQEWAKPWAKFPHNEKAKRYKSIVLQNYVKEDRIFEHRVRSKFIVDPWKATCLGIHFVWTSSGPNDDVKTEEALVYHYRNWKNVKDKQKRIEDVSVIERYGKKLVTRLEDTWIDIEKTLSIKSENFEK